jgi:pimeloyl-ACP methyl ester carboxylesterase
MKSSGKYVPANGVNYWVETWGEGDPLLLLHGGLLTTEFFGPVLPKLAEHRKVIGVHLHGHGRTELGDRKIRLEDIGRDLGVILQQLGVNPIDVMGFSFGAGAAFQLAVQYPEMVRRLVLVSMPYSQDGFFAEMLPQQAMLGAGMADMMKQTPMYRAYTSVAPKPENFPKLLDAMGEYMRQPYDWTDRMNKLTMPVMLVYGDSDMMRPEHIVSFYHLLGGGLRDAGWMREHMSKNRLAILPNLTHYEIGESPLLVETVLPFLNGNTGPVEQPQA